MIELASPREWQPVDWYELVEFCQAFASSVMFVLREKREDSPGAFSRAEHLTLLGRGVWRRGKRWPGTEIFDGKATIVSVELVAPVVAWLKYEAPSPDAWLEPEWPEDVAFIRPEGKVLYASVAHERMSTLYLRQPEMATLESSYSRLRSRLHRRRN